MYYIFIVDGRADKKFILDEVKAQISEVKINHEIYVTAGQGDATRFVRLYCEFHPKAEVCFIACGGTGTLSEVVNGVIGYEGKRVALLAYGTANNFTLHYPDRDFHSLKAILEGETKVVDAIKCNNDYAINVVNLGFDSMAAHYAEQYILKGATKPYIRATVRSMILNRFNNFRIIVDGERLSRFLTMFCTIANASHYGSNFKCAPHAVMDDGHLDVEVVRATTILTFFLMYRYFKDGHHMDSRLCRRHMVFRDARHIELSSKSLIYLCVDGETVASRHFNVDILDKAVTLQLPAVRNEEEKDVK